MISRTDFHILGNLLSSNRNLYAVSAVEDLLKTPAGGILQRVNRTELRSSMPPDIPYGLAECPCGCNRSLPVKRDAVNKRYFVICNEAYEEFSLSEAEHYMWRVNMPALIEFLHSTFKCRDKCIELISGRLWRLGQSTVTIAGTNRNIFYAPKLDLDVDAMLPKEQTHAILLLGENHPTTQISWGDRVLSLCDILTVSGKDLGIDFSRIESSVGALIPPEKEEPQSRYANVALHIEHMKIILKEYLDKLPNEYERTGKILKRPTLGKIASDMTARFGDNIDKSIVSRILNKYCKDDGCCPDKELQVLWEECTHPMMALNTKRSRRSKTKPISDDDDYSDGEYTMTEEEAFQTNGMRISKGV